jgi:hypothetical protein
MDFPFKARPLSDATYWRIENTEPLAIPLDYPGRVTNPTLLKWLGVPGQLYLHPTRCWVLHCQLSGAPSTLPFPCAGKAMLHLTFRSGHLRGAHARVQYKRMEDFLLTRPTIERSLIRAAFKPRLYPASLRLYSSTIVQLWWPSHVNPALRFPALAASPDDLARFLAAGQSSPTDDGRQY